MTTSENTSAIDHACDDRGGLEWVVVGGESRHVSDFARLKPKQRPEAMCPHCERRVILKLGEVRRHYAAHYPDMACIATARESALHLNTKLYLASKLSDFGGPLKVGFLCDECRLRCQRTWLERWDDVDVERRLLQRRPDILTMLRGEPVSAIEVHHTNPVTKDKRGDLDAAGTPWIEVNADPTISSGDAAWEPEAPLPIRAWSKSKRLLCVSCENFCGAKARAYQDYERRVHEERRSRLETIEKAIEGSLARLERDRECGQVIYRVRVITIYWPSGKPFTEVLMMVGDRRGKDEYVRVVTGSNGKTIGRAIRRSDIKNFEADLVKPALKIKRARAEAGKGIFHSPMKWVNIWRPLGERPRHVLNHWVNHLGLLRATSDDEIPELDQELSFAVDPESGTEFTRPFTPSNLPQRPEHAEGAGFAEISAMLYRELRRGRSRLYEWHHRGEKWFIRNANKQVRWDDEIAALLWPRREE